MKTILLAALAVSMFAAPAAAQPVKLRVFTAPDDNGVVTRESKARQVLLAKVRHELPRKAKGIVVLSDEAPASVQIMSIEVTTIGTETHTSSLGVALGARNLKETSPVHETRVHAIVRVGSLEKEIISVRPDGRSSDDIMLAVLIRDFVKDNAAQFR